MTSSYDGSRSATTGRPAAISADARLLDARAASAYGGRERRRRASSASTRRADSSLHCTSAVESFETVTSSYSRELRRGRAARAAARASRGSCGARSSRSGRGPPFGGTTGLEPHLSGVGHVPRSARPATRATAATRARRADRPRRTEAAAGSPGCSPPARRARSSRRESDVAQRLRVRPPDLLEDDDLAVDELRDSVRESPAATARRGGGSAALRAAGSSSPRLRQVARGRGSPGNGSPPASGRRRGPS